MKVDRKLSEVYRDFVKAKDRECFLNAFHTMMRFPSGTRRLYYVEGYAIGSFPMVVLHGWVEYDGRILETTPTWLAKEAARYYPARRYTRYEALRLAQRKDAMLPLVRHDWRDDRFNAARLRATLDCDGEEAFRFLYDRQGYDFKAIYDKAINYKPEAA